MENRNKPISKVEFLEKRLSEIHNQAYELYKQTVQLEKDKEKAVKACRKYREINKKLLEENALLHNNVDAISKTDVCTSVR
jgi:uncharacterized protein (UPF0335 family)